jgi:hypothetical protein
MVTTRNTTNTNYATVAWNCEFRDREGYKVGGGVALLHMLPKGAVTFDAQSFYNNANNAHVSIKCTLIDAEPLSAENQRLYQASGDRVSLDELSKSRNPTAYWSDDAIPSGIKVME